MDHLLSLSRDIFFFTAVFGWLGSYAFRSIAATVRAGA